MDLDIKYKSLAILGFFCAVIIVATDVSALAQDSTSIKSQLPDTLTVGESKSGYDDLPAGGGANSVNAELIADDTQKDTWFDIKFSKKVFRGYYGFKRWLNEKAHLAIGTDYMMLNQFASSSYSDRQASSGIFRFYGTWEAFHTKNNINGSLVFKIENRHLIGKGFTPRNFGYETGSALSTASFKDFKWGLTNFYWKQIFQDKFAFVAGIMDPGDWVDLYPLLNPFKYYLNEAFFNSPAMALPNQGLGISAVYKIIPHIYLLAGFFDANGQPENFLVDNFRSFFQVKEYFYWIEGGWTADKSIISGETIHLTYWHQDAREDAETEDSRGWCFSASKSFREKYIPFFRASFADGNGATLRHLIAGGINVNVFRHDFLGVSFSWGGPNDPSVHNQFGTEIYYAFQLTQHLNIAPDIQLTMNPSFNDEKNMVGVFSAFRLRYAL